MYGESLFPLAVEKSINKKPEVPERLKKIMDKRENFYKMEIDLAKIKNFISSKI